ncbi:MAG TPA: hypothetical protein VFV67_07990 [Actinophytocola sp.]|uniref:phage shock envelope stress response protein PspM n=1 Tax=Actinophytocola sp. TaxID=1872138 RepID=UPI002DBBD8A4|nr:hypothetical protein [Actinophytocola sp.]HEU5470578.1 hypothetical protein [Actinophytocola sp.]
MGRANELRRLIALAEQLRGPVMQHVQQFSNAVAQRGTNQDQLRRQRARLARRHAWASRWTTVWALVTAICMVITVAALLGAMEEATAIGSIIMGMIAGTFAFRSGQRMRVLSRQQRELEPAGSAGPARAALPPKGSMARAPIQRLVEAESTLADLLAQIARGGSVSTESVEHTRQTGADAAVVLRDVAAQLHAVERARDHAPPLERGPLADAVRRLRTQLDEGVDGYGSLVAAAGRVLAASSLGDPRHDLNDATEHLAGLALALRELSPE